MVARATNPKTPYYHLVPKELHANLEFRRRMIALGGSSRQAAEEIWIMCARDILFYINTFGWLLEPREAKKFPFITYDFQDPFILTIQEAVGNHDLVTEKSRDMGATWCHLYVMEHFWHFHAHHTFLLLSRKEELVDKRGDPKSLMVKLDFIHEHQPGWLVPWKERNKLHMRNLDMEGTIDGESTNEFAGVADRRTGLLLDEFSKMDKQDIILTGTRDVTRSRFFLFTPQGAANSAFDIAHNPNFKKVTLHWSLHPLKKPGLYTSHNGVVEILDKEYVFPPDYNFVTDGLWFFGNGRVRSPWFDGQCRRAQHPKEIAQELEIDYQGSDYGFFMVEQIQRLIDETSMPAWTRGMVDFEESSYEPIGFAEEESGPLELWCPLLGQYGTPAKGRGYVIEGDISVGTGASNSCLAIWEQKTNEKVAQFLSSQIGEYAFGKIAVVLAKFFDDAFIIWEANGPGRSFGRAVIESGYRNIYYRTNEQRLMTKASDFPGWFSTPDGKRDLLTSYRRDIQERKATNRSRSALKECLEFVRRLDGSVAHRRSTRADDPGAARYSHGDIVTADALACKMLRQIAPPEQKQNAEIPARSVGGRRRAAERELAKAKEW